MMKSPKYKKILLGDYNTLMREYATLKIASQNFEERAKQSRELDEHKSEFLDIVTHELKTPLTSVKAFTQILEQRFLHKGDTESALMLSKMNAQIYKLQVIIADLLDITKIRSGKLRFHPEKFKLNDLIQEIAEEMQRLSPDIDFEIQVNTPIQMFADREKVGQVLANLLTNAIKYSTHNKRIIIRAVKTSQAIKLHIQDFGIGISTVAQKNIFTRFYRAPGKSKQTYPGLGLGLYIVQEIMSLHHGSIKVKSIKGEGSTFTATFKSNIPLHEK